MTSRTAVIDFLAALDDDELDELLTEARDVTDEKAPKAAHEETSYPDSWRTQ